MNHLHYARYWLMDLEKQHSEASGLNILDFLRSKVRTERITLEGMSLEYFSEKDKREIRNNAFHIIDMKENGYAVRT